MQLTAITTAQHFIQAFSWMLIHSLWQGLLLSVVAGLLLSLNRKASSAVRYNLVLAQLLLFAVACGGTFLWEWYKTPAQYTGIHIAVSPAGDTALSLRSFVNSCITYFTANSPVIVLIWFILFLVRTVRIMGSALFINRARHRFIYQPTDAWKEKVNTLCEKLQLKRAVQLLESGYVNVPMVIGHLKPVILIPAGLLAGLPAGQVEAVLLHELAHIRRNDYVVNCLQTIVETVFFFNPGLLWISSVLRDERENCCDDIALAQTKNKKEFIQALVSFKEYALERKNYVVAFPGEKKNSLLNRASRILHNQNKPLGTSEKVFFLAGILVLSIVVATASIAQMHVVQKAKKVNHTLSHQHTNSAPPLDEHFRAIAEQQSPTKPKDEAPELKQQHTGNYTYKPSKGSADANPPKPPAQEPGLPPEPASSDRGMQQQTVVKRQEISAIEKKRSTLEREQFLKDQQQQAHDAEQAKKDQEQAIQDQKQANRDQEQAGKDQQQAHLDEAQAKKNQEQANSDRENARKAQQLEQLQKKEDVMQNNPNPPL